MEEWPVSHTHTHLLRSVDSILIIPNIFDLVFYSGAPLSLLWEGIPLGALDDCWKEPTLPSFDLWWFSLENGRLFNSEAYYAYLTRPSCTCGLYGNVVSVLILFSGETLVSLIKFLLGPSSISGVNELYLRSMFYVTLICAIWRTRFVQLVGIVPYLMNGTTENPSSNTTWNWCETWPVSELRTRSTDNELNVLLKIYIPAHHQGYH